MFKYKMLTNDALLFLYNEVASGRLSSQLKMDLSDELIECLKRLSYEEVAHLSEHTSPLVDVKINMVALKVQIKRLYDERKRKEFISRAVEVKASKKLLAEYYGVGQEELHRLRITHEVDIKRGRVKKIDDEISSSLWAEFTSLPIDMQDTGSTGCFEEIVKLAEKYNLPVISVYDTLSESHVGRGKSERVG